MLAVSWLPALSLLPNHTQWVLLPELTRAERGRSCQRAHGPADRPAGEAGVSACKEHWGREGHVGSPHAFPSAVNRSLAEPVFIHSCAA